MGLPLLAPRRSDAQAEISFASGQLAAPMPFWGSVGAAYEAQRHVSQLGARDSLQAAALADRDAEIRKRLGYGYTPPGPRATDPPQFDPESRLGAQFGSNPAQGAAPQYLSPGYEAWVDQQRQLHPDVMADIPTAQQLHDQTSQRIGGYARAGAAAAEANPLGAFVGGLAASFTDPINAAATLIPVGGEARLGSLLLGTGRQAAIWATIAAAEAPFKAAEAERSGGPAYTTQEAVSDVEGAAVVGAVLHAGGTLLSAGAVRLLGKLAPEAFAAKPGGALGGEDASGGAGEAQSPPGPSGGAPGEPAQPSSSAPADLDADGRYPLTPDGHIVSDAGGPVQFDTPTEAARFILREANRTGDQRFEPANHPDGGYTARELTRAAPAADIAPDVEPDAVPAAAAAVEQGANDDAAIGPQRDGGDYDAAHAAVAQGDAPVAPAATQDPDTLLTEADPQTGPPADTPPAAAGVTLGDSTSYRGRDIYAATFDPQVVNTAPEVFQYKAGGDAAGVTDRLRGVQTWDPTSAGRAMVFEDAGGAYTVADGHQRLGLAKRLSGADFRPVLDEAGAPKVFYHGSKEHFPEYDARGAWFTDDPQYAEGFAEGVRPGTGDNVHPVHLDMRSMHEAPADTWHTDDLPKDADSFRSAHGYVQGVSKDATASAYFVRDAKAQARSIFDQRAREPIALDALLFREADGWSAQDVRTMAALKNIREGSGTPLDAAKVLRDHPEALNDDSLPVTGTLAEQGRGLARLSDDAFGAVVNDVISQHHAALIGNMAGDKPDLHAGMVDLLHRGRPANVDEARALVSEALQADWLRGEGSMADLFGGEPPAQSTIIARAKVTASVLRSLRQNARLFSTLVGNADAIEAGGNALARSANEASLAVNRAAEAMISKLAQRSGEVGDAMRAAAAQVIEGRPVAEAAKNVLSRVTEQIRMADEANATRKAELDPDPAPREASVRGELFDGPGDRGQQRQLLAKPEDAAEEAALFDKPTGMGNAADILRSCAPE